MHWADGATLDFLTFLARTGRADAITVVATVRSDETPAEPAVTRWLAYARGSGHAREIRLGPLTRDEMAEQVNGLTGGQLPPAAWAELYARGEGNPFFTEQLVAEAMAGGGLGGLPARLAELLTARVSDCGPQAWPLLAAVSVAGRPLTEDQLAGVTGLDAGALRAGLRELASRSLAETAPGGGGGRLGLPLITEALALFDQAPPSADHAEALFYYGHYLFTGQGRREEAVTAIRRGLAIAEAAGATALIPRMQPLLAYHHFLAGQMDEGFALLRHGRALAESAGDGEACVLIDVYESDALIKTARVADAAEVARRGLASARQAGLEAFWTTAILAGNGAEALLHQGRTAQAAALIGPLTDGPAGRDTWLAHVHRAEIDLLSGDAPAAIARQEQIAATARKTKEY